MTVEQAFRMLVEKGKPVSIMVKETGCRRFWTRTDEKYDGERAKSDKFVSFIEAGEVDEWEFATYCKDEEQLARSLRGHYEQIAEQGYTPLVKEGV